VRDFAKATGQLAKTDALDAGVIAHFAEGVHPMPRPFPDALTQQLEALVQRRRQLLEMLVAERHRMALAHATVRDNLARHIDYLQRLIDETDAEISTFLRTTQGWRETDDLLQSTPGIRVHLRLHAAEVLASQRLTPQLWHDLFPPSVSWGG
jgi:transposase